MPSTARIPKQMVQENPTQTKAPTLLQSVNPRILRFMHNGQNRPATLITSVTKLTAQIAPLLWIHNLFHLTHKPPSGPPTTNMTPIMTATTTMALQAGVKIKTLPSAEGMKLYAVWIAPLENTSFQDFTCPTNTDMPIGTVIALRDNRDNEVYTVAKLADGNCWMTENLRLDNNATINATNTNSPISTFTALSPSSNSWCTDTSASCYNQSLLNTNNRTNTVSPMTGTNANIYSYGNYYNWYSATAGNGTRNVSSGTVAGDLCPAGWHLPYGGSETSEKGGNTSGGFYYLNQQMGGNTSAQDSNNWRSFPNNFVYSGNWNGSSAGSRGGTGLYWSSTAYRTTDFAYILYFYSGYLYPGTYDSRKNWGYPVRCVQNQ